MVLGMVSTNCYLVYNDDTKEGVVVDPADNGAPGRTQDPSSIQVNWILC